MIKPYIMILTIAVICASFPAQAIRIAPRLPQMQPIISPTTPFVHELAIPEGSVIYAVTANWNGTVGAFCAAQNAVVTGGITCAGIRKGLDSTYSSYNLANCAFGGDRSNVVMWQSIACQAP